MKTRQRLLAVAIAAVTATAGMVAVSAPAQAATCGVKSDGRLWCGNAFGAGVYPGAGFSPGPIDYLRTTYSWFDCWTTGSFHDGGNYTWYHTVGDDYGRAGYTPASQVYTSSTFDANPSNYGLRHC